MSEKIRITADDLTSPEVEAKIQQKEYIQRAQEHQARQAASAAGQTASFSLLRNSIFYMTLFGFVGGLMAWLVGEFTLLFDSEGGIWSLILTLIFSSMAGLCIAIALSTAESIVSQNWMGALVNGAVGMCCGILGGFAGGFMATILYSIMAEDDFTVKQVFARSIGWACVGAFLAIGPGVVLRSFKRLAIGLAGGFLGGLIGGALFDIVAITLQADFASRAIGLISIGTLAGLGTGLIENVAKRGWLYVSAGLIAGKQFIIYKDPTYIGSSPQCEIYLFKDAAVAPQHAAIRRIPGGHEIRDLKNGEGTFVNGQAVGRAKLRSGDRIQIGDTAFTFQEKESG